MEGDKDNQSTYFKDNIICGIKGDYNEVKWLKVFLENNPQLKIYITEREAHQDKNIGQKRKVEVVKYLEIRDNDTDNYNIIAQMKLEDDKIADNYPILVASKEVKYVESQQQKDIKPIENPPIKETKTGDGKAEQIVEFKPVGLLKNMRKLDKGYIKAIMKETNHQGFDESEMKQMGILQAPLGVLSGTSIIPALDQSAGEEDGKTSASLSKDSIFVAEHNRLLTRNKLEQKIRELQNKNIETTKQRIKQEIDIKPEKEFDQMLDDICYVQKEGSKKIYKLKTMN